MASNLKTNKYVENLKQGFQDIQTVSQEGNFKLFVKQFVAVLAIFLLFRYASKEFTGKVNGFKGQMDAIRVQQTSEREYEANKQKLLSLEPRFPDIAQKNEWLLSQILGIFKNANIAPKVSGSQTENASNPTYVTASLPVSMEMQFTHFAEFLASLENLESFIKISSFSVTKDTDPLNLGNNSITLQFNTIFPKEKIAKSIVKDYDKLMKERKEKEKKNAKGGK